MNSLYRCFFKRLVDIVISVIGLVLTLPLLIIVYICILVVMGSPVIFTQLRPGLHGRPFQIYKFRTMLDLYDNDGHQRPDKDRITILGKFLRSSSIDELPELINVLRGDMSIVGPRPLLMKYLPLYSSTQFRRHEMRPGITGLAQVKGRNKVNWSDRFEMDVWYVENVSFLLDFKILCLTIYRVFSGHGVNYGDGHTMPEFLGNVSDID